MRTGRTVRVIILGMAAVLVAVALTFLWRGQTRPIEASPSPAITGTSENGVPPAKAGATSQTHSTFDEVDPQSRPSLGAGETLAVTEDSKPSPEHSSVNRAEPEEQPQPQTLSADEEMKQRLVGFWFHQESGEHWIENRSDGTARLLLKLDFVASLLYGQRTTMELTWDVKDGVLTHSIVSGTPQTNVDSLIKAFGKTRTYEVLETTEQRMLLKSKSEPDKKDLWTRIPPPAEWQTAPSATDSPPSETTTK